MADPYSEISRDHREAIFERFAEYRAEHVDIPYMDDEFRQNPYISDVDGFKGYDNPVPIEDRPSRHRPTISTRHG
jgi:hypothetical protein